MSCRRPLSIHNYVVSQLDKHFINEVEDIITVTPAQNPYTILKTELIKRLSVSEEQQIRQLFLEEEWGERKPTLFLRHLRSLAGTGLIRDKLLCTIWHQRLPSYVQAILQTQPDTVSLDSPANTADTIIQVHHPAVPSVHTTAISSNDQFHSRLEELFCKVSSLETELKSIRSQNSRSRSQIQTTW